MLTDDSHKNWFNLIFHDVLSPCPDLNRGTATASFGTFLTLRKVRIKSIIMLNAISF